MKVGILGGGQLGQMLTLAGYPLGIQTVCFETSSDVPAALVGPVVAGDLDDADAVKQWASDVDVVTYEFENFPADLVAPIADMRPLRPGLRPLAEAQDRWAEKALFEQVGIPVAPFRRAADADALIAAIEELGLPLVVKTRRGGYDGKGQVVVRSESDIEAAGELVRLADVIVEGFVNFDREVSVIGVRGVTGEIAIYPLVENEHRSGILHQSRCPARGDEELEKQASAFMTSLLVDLDYTGVLALELFAANGVLLGNEMAPRVHNTGHWTIEGAETSQFENHLRAITGMPLGSTAARGVSLMRNLIGSEPARDAVLSVPGAHLHLYGKSPRPGRKLGHVTVTAPDRETLAERAAQLESALA